MKRVTTIATLVALTMFVALGSAAQAGQKGSNRQSMNDHKDRNHDGRDDRHDGHRDRHHDGDSCGYDSCGHDSCHHHGGCDNGDGWNTIHPIPAPPKPTPIIHRFPVGTIYRLNQTTSTNRFKQLGLLNRKLVVGRPPNTTNGTIPTLGNPKGLANEIGSSFGNLAGSVISGAANTVGSVAGDVVSGLEGFASGLASAL